MNNTELESLLSSSLEDLKLDPQEKARLKTLPSSIRGDQLSFVRNKAFDLARPYMQTGGADAISALNWLEKVVKAIQVSEPRQLTEASACFSPGDACRNKIISLMRAARKEVEICLFTISDNRITESIMAAHKRGVKVTIISDNDKANDRGSDVDRLSDYGVQLVLDDSPYHMHHKFALFDRRILLNGSFNWTRSASDVNEENLIVTSDAKLVEAFSAKFDELKAQFS